jgi:N-acyl homoserine lactone hydrolase
MSNRVRYTVDALVEGFPGKAAVHGGLGWSGITLLRGGDRVVLIDAGGFGVRAPLAEALAQRDIAPADVTDVLLTHVHYDHAVNALLFEEAELCIAEADLAWAREKPAAFDAVPELYAEALDRNPRICRLDGDGPVLPGIDAIAAPGHTPGCLVYRVEAEDGVVLFAGDAVKNRAELLSGEVDMTVDRAASEASVRLVRDLWAATPGAVLVPGHDLPMRAGPDGRPAYIGRRTAGIDAWFGEDLGATTRFDLRP